MIILVVDDKTRNVFTEVISENEVGGDVNAAYEFSLAKGGNSGYSFGITQIDVNNNPWAGIALRDMEFTTDEVIALRSRKVTDLTPYDAKLKAHKDIVAKWDLKQIDECLTWPIYLCADKVTWQDRRAFLGVCDYHNQIGMSKGGKLHSYLMGLKIPVTLEIIRDFKLGILWGKNDPEDVERRYETILRLGVNL